MDQGQLKALLEQVRSGEIRSSEICAGEVGLGEIGTYEVGAREIGAVEARIFQRGARKLRLLQNGLGEVCADQACGREERFFA